MIELDLKQGCLLIVKDNILSGLEEPVELTRIVTLCDDNGKAETTTEAAVRYIPLFSLTADIPRGLEELLKAKEEDLKKLGANKIYCIYRLRPLRLLEKEIEVASVCQVGMFGTE